MAANHIDRKSLCSRIGKKNIWSYLNLNILEIINKLGIIGLRIGI